MSRQHFLQAVQYGLLRRRHSSVSPALLSDHWHVLWCGLLSEAAEFSPFHLCSLAVLFITNRPCVWRWKLGNKRPHSFASVSNLTLKGNGKSDSVSKACPSVTANGCTLCFLSMHFVRLDFHRAFRQCLSLENASLRVLIWKTLEALKKPLMMLSWYCIWHLQLSWKPPCNVSFMLGLFIRLTRHNKPCIPVNSLCFPLHWVQYPLVAAQWFTVEILHGLCSVKKSFYLKIPRHSFLKTFR